MTIAPHRRVAMFLTRVTSLFTASTEKILGQYGLTPVSWGVLLKISLEPGQSTHGLAELCLQTDQAIGQIVVKLAKQGLVTRTPTFGRAIIHEVTGKGRDLLIEVEPLLDAAIKEYFSDLCKKEQIGLGNLLEQILLGRGSESLRKHILAFGEEAMVQCKAGGGA